MTQTDIDFIIQALNNKCTNLVQEIVANANDAMKYRAANTEQQESAPVQEQSETEEKGQVNE